MAGSYFEADGSEHFYGQPPGGLSGGQRDSDEWNSVRIGLQRLPGAVTSLLDLPSAVAFGTRPLSSITDWVGEATGIQPGKWADDNEYKFSPEYYAQQRNIGRAYDQNVTQDQGLLREAMDVIKSIPELATAYAQNPGYTLNQVLQSLPAMLAGGVGGRGLMGIGKQAAKQIPLRGAQGVAGQSVGALERAVGTRWASPLAAGAGEGGIAAGQNMQQVMEALGPDATPEQVRMAAATSIGAGAFDMLIAAGGGRIAQRLGFETPETLMAGGQRVGMRRSFVPRVLGGAASEGVLQELPQSIQEGGFQNLGEGRSFADSGPEGQGLMRQGIEGMLAGMVMGGGANVISGRGRTFEGDVTAREISDQATASALARGEAADLLRAEQARFPDYKGTGELDLEGGQGSNRLGDAGVGPSPVAPEAAVNPEFERRAEVYRSIINSSSFSPEQKAQAQEALIKLGFDPRAMPNLSTMQASPQGELFPRGTPQPALNARGEGAQQPLLAGNEGMGTNRMDDQTGALHPALTEGQAVAEPPGTRDMFSGPVSAQPAQAGEGESTHDMLRAFATGDKSLLWDIGHKAAKAAGRMKEFAELYTQLLQVLPPEPTAQAPLLDHPPAQRRRLESTFRKMLEIVEEGEQTAALDEQIKKGRAERLEKAAIYQRVLDSPSTSTAQKREANAWLEENEPVPGTGMPVRTVPMSDAARKGQVTKAMGGKKNARLLDKLKSAGETAFIALHLRLKTLENELALEVKELAAKKKGGIKAARSAAAEKKAAILKAGNETLSKLEKQFDKALEKKHFGKLIALQKQVELEDAKTGEAIEGMSPELPAEVPTSTPERRERSRKTIELWRSGYLTGQQVNDIFWHLGYEGEKSHFDRADKILGPAIEARAKAVSDKAKKLGLDLENMNEKKRSALEKAVDHDGVQAHIKALKEEAGRENWKRMRFELAALMNIARYRYENRDEKLASDLKLGMIDALETAEDAELAIERLKSEKVINSADLIAAQNAMHRMDEGSGEDIAGFTESTDRAVKSFLANIPKDDADVGVDERSQHPMRVLNKAALRLNTEEDGEFKGRFSADTELVTNKESGQEETKVTRKAVDKLIRYVLGELRLYDQRLSEMTPEEKDRQMAAMSDRYGEEVIEVVLRYMDTGPMVQHARSSFTSADYLISGNVKSERVSGKKSLLSEEQQKINAAVGGLMLDLDKQSGNPDTVDRRQNLKERLNELYASAALRGEGKYRVPFANFVVALLTNQPGTKIYNGTSRAGNKANNDAMVLRRDLLNASDDPLLGDKVIAARAKNIEEAGKAQRAKSASRTAAAQRSVGTNVETSPAAAPAAKKERSGQGQTGITDSDGNVTEFKVEGTAVEDDAGGIIFTDLTVENLENPDDQLANELTETMNDQPAAKVIAAIKGAGIRGADVDVLSNQIDAIRERQVDDKRAADDAKAASTKLEVGDTYLEKDTGKWIKDVLAMWSESTFVRKEDEKGKKAKGTTLSANPIWDYTTPAETRVLDWLKGKASQHTIGRAKINAKAIGASSESDVAETVIRSILFRLETLAEGKRRRFEADAATGTAPNLPRNAAAERAAVRTVDKLRTPEPSKGATGDTSAQEPSTLPGGRGEGRVARTAAKAEGEQTRKQRSDDEAMAREDQYAGEWIDDIDPENPPSLSDARRIAKSLGITLQNGLSVPSVILRIKARLESNRRERASRIKGVEKSALDRPSRGTASREVEATRLKAEREEALAERRATADERNAARLAKSSHLAAWRRAAKIANQLGSVATGELTGIRAGIRAALGAMTTENRRVALTRAAKALGVRRTGQLKEIQQRVMEKLQEPTPVADTEEFQSVLEPITGRRSFIKSMLGLLGSGIVGKANAFTVPEGLELALRQGDINGALQLIATTSRSIPFRTLAKKLIALNSKDISLRVFDPGQVGPISLRNAYGSVTLDRRTDGSSKAVINLRGDIGLTEHTILHEMIHAALMSRYDSFSYYLANPILQGRNADPTLKLLHQVWNEFQREVKKAYPTREALDKAPASLRAAALSIDEFLAYSMTGETVQTWMRGRRYQGKTLWGRFKEFVKSFLGIGGTEPSWLDAALRVGNEVLDAATLDQPDFAVSRTLAIKAKSLSSKSAYKSEEDNVVNDPLYGFTVHGNGNLTNYRVTLEYESKFGEFSGNPIFGYAIKTPEGDLLGFLTAAVNDDGIPTHVLNIQIGETATQAGKGVRQDLKNGGWGTKIMQALLEASPTNTIFAVDVQKSAVPIWQAWNARWPTNQLEHGNAYLTLKNFESRRDLNANPWRRAEMEKKRGRTAETAVGEGETQDLQDKGIIESKTWNVSHLSSNLASIKGGFKKQPLGISFARAPEEQLSSPTLAEPKGKRGVVKATVSGRGIDYTKPKGKKFIDGLYAQYQKAEYTGMPYDQQVIDHLRRLGVDWVNGWNGIGESPELHVLNADMASVLRETQDLQDLDFTKDFQSVIDGVAYMPQSLKVSFAPAAAQVKAAFNGAVRLLAPINDVFESMERMGLTTVAAFRRVYERRASAKRRWEEEANHVWQAFRKLRYDDWKKVEGILSESTRKGWGYQPSWLEDSAGKQITVPINDEIKAQWDAMSNPDGSMSDSQKIADGVFKFNDKMWAAKDNWFNAAHRESFDEERAAAGGDETKLKDIAKRERTSLARYGRNMPRLIDKPYAAFKRFGKYAIVGKSEEFEAAEESLKDPTLSREQKEELASQLREMKSQPQHYEVQFKDWAATTASAEKDMRTRLPRVYSFERTQLAEQQYYELPHHVLSRLKAEISDLAEGSTGKGLRPEIVNSLQRATSNLYLEMLSQANTRKNELQRLGVAGHGEMMQAFISQARADANLVSSLQNNRDVLQAMREMKKEVDRGSTDEQRFERSKLYNEVVHRYLNLQHHSDSTWQQRTMRGNSIMLLVWSPSYLIQNSTQVYMMALPKLASNFGWFRSAALINKTYVKLGLENTLIDDEVNLDKITGLYGKDMARAISELEIAGKLNITINMDLGKWANKGLIPKTAFGRWIRENKISAATGRGLSFVGALPGRVEMMNRIVTGIAAYQLKKADLSGRAKPDDMSAEQFEAHTHDKAVEYAAKIIDESQGAYDDAGAGRIFQPGNAPGLPVKLLLQFRKFQIIQLSFMIRDFKRAYSRTKPANLTPAEWMEEKAVAKRALAFAIAHYGVMTGAMGLPFVGLVAGAFAALGGDDDDELRPSLLAATPFATSEDRLLTELWLRKQLGGGALATLLTKGVPTLAGIDLSAQIGAGTAAYMLPYAKKGKTATETARNVAWASLGATAGTVDRVSRGYELLASGELWKGLEAGLPRGPSEAIQAFRESQSGKVDRSGTILTPAHDISAWQSALSGIGMKTTADTERNLLQQKIRLTEQHYAERRREIGHEYIEAMRDRDMGKVAELRREWMKVSASMRKQGLKAPLPSALHQFWQRELRDQRQVIGGVVTKRSTRNLALEGI